MPRSKRAVTGICRLCGQSRKLTPEHVPPEKAFNDSQILAYVIGEEEHKPRRIKGKQNGNKVYTLCEQCNIRTGGWYGGEYAKWAHTLAEVVRLRMKASEHCYILLKQVYPLRFLKQVVTCFFSVVDSPKALFAQDNPALVDFVLKKEETHLPSGYRFFLNLHQSGVIRSYGAAARMPVIYNDEGVVAGHSPIPFAEMTHFPFSLVMTCEHEDFPGAYEITSFANYRYDDCTDVFLDLTLTRQTRF